MKIMDVIYDYNQSLEINVQ